MIKGINKDMLRRYVEMRQKLDAEAETIQSLASLLALFRFCGDEELRIDPLALGHVHQLMERSILNIWEMLDDFIYIVEARRVVEEGTGRAE